MLVELRVEARHDLVEAALFYEGQREMGYEPPVICTPQELLEIDDAN